MSKLSEPILNLQLHSDAFIINDLNNKKFGETCSSNKQTKYSLGNFDFFCTYFQGCTIQQEA